MGKESSGIAWPLVVVALSCLLVAVRSSEVPLPEWHLHNDFGHYYISSNLLKSQINPYTQDLSQHYQHYGLVNWPRINQATNPPALVTLLVPLTAFSPLTAFWFWSALQLAALVSAVYLLVGHLTVSVWQRLGFVAATLAIYPVTVHFERGQAQLLVLFLIVLGTKLAFGALHQCTSTAARTNLAYFLWGLATSLKLFTWPLALIALRYGGFRGALSFGLGFVVLTLPMLAILGPQALIDFALNSLPFVQNTVARFTGGNSLIAALIHTAHIMPDKFMMPSAHAIRAINASFAAIAAILVSLELRSARLRPDPWRSVCFALVLSCLFSPTTWAHYMPLCFPALFYLYGWTKTNPERAVNGLTVLIAAVGVALTQGRLMRGDFYWQIFTAWWGVVAMLFISLLLLACRERK